ncbi:hypothetical protein C1752_03810 [Acaryochloris thomasi RCC1774]|uniref:Antitoxin n=1 Tax=Acaryochloris thomasi RCC1774 TaxID=1764569 RepID=A0A2W1JQ20_9CYAN|nr:hypothetical protein C1752_03810 [Acaryochloris thomasi RCC1774]
MRVYTYSEARQQLSELLNQAQSEEVLIKRRDGTTFSVRARKTKESPFDIKGFKSDVSQKDILSAVEESRGR